MSWRGRAEQAGAAIRAGGRWRSPRTLDGRGVTGTLDGTPVVSFASNDYLGLAAHPAPVAAAHAALDRWGAGAGSARLIVGSRPVHDELEAELAAWKGTEAAVSFPTGFAANLGVLGALGGLGGPGTLICSDVLNHASIIDGCRLARSRGAEVAVYDHLDLDHLKRLLGEAGGRPALVVTDSVFSMDGDAVELAGLGAVCASAGALLVLDEAHAVLGPEAELEGEVVRVGTLSKTLGALGGFVAGDRALVELLVNTARSYIFTTAASPADAAAALAALRVLRSGEGDALVARLRQLVGRVAGPGHHSPIIPVILGEEAAALAAAERLLARGLLVPAIRPPTVPVGSARLRVTLSAAHTDEQVGRLVAALDEVAAGR